MKKIVLLISSISFLTIGLHKAQENTASGPSKISYGVTIGASLSNLTNQQLKVGAKHGFLAGGYVSYKLMDILSLQLNPQYMQQGGKSYYQSFGSTISDLINQETSISNITLHNVEIPLLVKLNLVKLSANSPLTPFVFVGAGLGVNFLATNRSEVLIQFNSGRDAVYSDYGTIDTDDIETLQGGIYLGIGGDTKVKSMPVSIDLRYRYGINTIMKNYDVNTYVNGFGDSKSNTIALTIGIGLNK